MNDVLSQLNIGLHVNYPLFLSDFNKTWISTRQIFEKTPQYEISWNPSRGSRVVPCGQTDMTKLIIAFRNFTNAPWNVLHIVRYLGLLTSVWFRARVECGGMLCQRASGSWLFEGFWCLRLPWCLTSAVGVTCHNTRRRPLYVQRSPQTGWPVLFGLCRRQFAPRWTWTDTTLRLRARFDFVVTRIKTGASTGMRCNPGMCFVRHCDHNAVRKLLFNPTYFARCVTRWTRYVAPVDWLKYSRVFTSPTVDCLKRAYSSNSSSSLGVCWRFLTSSAALLNLWK